MAVYTVEVRGILESMSQMNPHSSQFNDIDALLNTGLQLFDNYPIWAEEYRTTLNKRILSHFFMREIGYETVSLWRFALNRKMNEIMPYYNKLYEVAVLIDDPLSNYDGVNDTVGKKTGTGQNSTEKHGGSVTDVNGKQTLTGKDDRTVNTDVNEQTHMSFNKTGTDKVGHRGDDTSAYEETSQYDLNSNGTTHKEETNSGKDRYEKGGVESTYRSGGHTTTRNDTGHDSSVGTKNSNDTPQGSVTTLTSKYLTNSTYEDSSSDNTLSSTENVVYNEEKDTTSFTDRADETKYGKVTITEGSDARTDKQTAGKQYTDTKTYNSDETTTYDTTDVQSGNVTTESTTTDVLDKTAETKTNDTTNTTHDETITGNTTTTENDSSKNTQSGRYGVSQSKLFSEFADALVNIDMLIINDLEELFMQIF